MSDLSKGGLTVKRVDDPRCPDRAQLWLVIHDKTNRPIAAPGTAGPVSKTKRDTLKYRDFLLSGGWNWNEWTDEHTPAWAAEAAQLRSKFRLPS